MMKFYGLERSLGLALQLVVMAMSVQRMVSLAFCLCVGPWHRDLAVYSGAPVGCCTDPGSVRLITTILHDDSDRHLRWTFNFIILLQSLRSFIRACVCVCVCCAVLRLMWILVQKSVLGRAGLGPTCILQFPSLGCMLFVFAWFTCSFSLLCSQHLFWYVWKKHECNVFFVIKNYHTHEKNRAFPPWIWKNCSSLLFVGLSSEWYRFMHLLLC